MNTGSLRRAALIPAAVIGLAFCAPAMAAPEDPWEGFNRAVYRFNDTVDRYALKPVAQAYQTVTPKPVDNAISHFFDNLASPITLVNQLLQGKPVAALTTTARLMWNSTLGLGGLFDVATRMGLPREKEDFGQTLAVWGVHSGPYLMLPVFGPSTVRDAFGRVTDIAPDPRSYVNSTPALAGTALDLIDTRADLLSAEQVIEGDRYQFIRDYYLQQRKFAIADGQIEGDEFLDESADDSSGKSGE